VLHFELSEVPVLSGAGKGVRGIKIDAQDQVLGAAFMSRPSDCLRVMTTAEKELVLGQMKYPPVSRGGKGDRVSHRTDLSSINRPPIELVDWAKLEGDEK